MITKVQSTGLTTRSNALSLLEKILQENKSLEEAFAECTEFDFLEQRDKAFVRFLIGSTLRRLGQIDDLLNHFLKRPLPQRDKQTRNILRMGITQIIFMKTPPHAVVNTSVNLCQKTGNSGKKGLVNALLRRVLLEGQNSFSKQDPAFLNTPNWMWKTWKEAYGQSNCREIATTHLTQPALDLTVKSDPEFWAKKLNAQILPTGSLRIVHNGKIQNLKGFNEGAWWVQDTAASIPARVLIASLQKYKNPKILDLCAAPGGKTAQLATSQNGVIAVDRSKSRTKLLQENMKRLNLTVKIITSDIKNYKPNNPVDGILLDAPCTATGTIRRHPDVLHNRKPEDVRRLAEIQLELLKTATELLKTGAILIYSVCTLQPEEGPDVIQKLLALQNKLKRVPIDPLKFGLPQSAQTQTGDLRTLPFHLGKHGGMDGFFISRLKLDS